MKLGDLVRDKITRIEGILISQTRHLTGCDTCFIQPPYNMEKGEMPDGLYVDVMAIEVVKEKAVRIPHLSDVEPSG